ncbi:hypothetical protein AVEN_101631-1 [Araneus ventricosus]|uniref:Uncharacterized protein n=1 Tax=Araneus ventricosus TaxID=182803 RepID=A0A4Y2EYD5_ARAVE|nr:hypothetical protein AVEN_101631-1 [Araneus ventricosus]
MLDARRCVIRNLSNKLIFSLCISGLNTAKLKKTDGFYSRSHNQEMMTQLYRDVPMVMSLKFPERINILRIFRILLRLITHSGGMFHLLQVP